MGRSETPNLGGATRGSRPLVSYACARRRIVPSRSKVTLGGGWAGQRPPPGGPAPTQAGRGPRFPTETVDTRRVLEPGRCGWPPEGSGAERIAEGPLLGQKSFPHSDGGDGSRRWEELPSFLSPGVLLSLSYLRSWGSVGRRPRCNSVRGSTEEPRNAAAPAPPEVVDANPGSAAPRARIPKA